jgi:chromosome segregation ATPase
MEALLGILTLVGFGTTGVLLMKLQSVNAQKATTPAAKSLSPSSTKEVDSVRAEVGQLKAELQKKQKTIEEMREEAKKKARREGMKAAKEGEGEGASSAEKVENGDVKKFKAAAVALEQQIAELTKDKLRAVKEAEVAIKEKLHAELDRVKAEAKKLESTLDELRASIKKKAESRPDVPGSGLDLKSLPTDVVQELARYYRKGEEFERLYAIAQGQLQLEKDKLADVQRRYYAVCRELAVAAAGPRAAGVTDEEAKAVAERVVSGTDAMAARSETGEAGPAKKKRRRRRKRKPGVEGAAEASSEGDEGGEGDDGDEGDDDGDVEASAAPEALEPKPAAAAQAESA